MQSLDTACEEGERAIKRFKPNRSSFPLLTSQEPSCSSTQQEFVDNPGGKMPFDIFTKLLELHEETNEGIEGSGTKYTTLLLEKLVAKERLNTLIVNLHPGNKGYSLAFRVVSRSDPNYIDDTANMIETKQWPYEVDELLRYIDNEELPPFIIDLLEPQFSYLFYNGCIIAEVRDYRQAYPEYKCDIHHVLLRPTQKSILADINNIVEEKSDWSNEEKDQLESQLLMANEPSLCLEPDITTYQHLTELSNRKRTWNTHEFRRMAKKFSQVTVNRKRKLDQFTHKPGLEILDFVSRTRTKPKIGTTQNLTSKPVKKIPEDIKPVPIPNLECPQIAPPSTEIVINEFKTYTRPQATSDCLPQLIEEYVLETDMPSKDKDKPRVYHIKLSILQRPSNSEYLGELYLDRDHKKNEQNGVACRFSLGSRANATRYIHQFTEIFTESGRKSVRIRYGLSPGYKERVASAQAQAQQQVHMQITNQQNTQQIQSQMIQNQTYTAPIVNGSIAGTIGVQMQMQNPVSSVPTLQSHLQSSNATKSTSQVLSNQEQEINALATKLMNSAQQFQAAAQLVTSGVKATQQTLRTTTSPQAVSLTQTGQPFQLLAPLQRPRGAQQASSPQQQTRSLQRSTPITIKMAAPNTANASQVNLPHLQQFQQICLNQPDMLGKIRRRSSNSELQ